MDGNRDTVGARVVAVLGSVDDAVGEQDTDGDAKLITSNERSTDLLGCDFGHVEDDDGGNETNTSTSDETTDRHQSEPSGCSLQNTADGEDEAAHDDGHATTDKVGNITSNDGSKEGTGRQNGGGQRLVAGGQMEGLLVGIVVGHLGVGVGETGVLANKVRHTEDTSHPSSVITEEDTSKRSKGAHQVGLDGDGGLDTRGIGGPRDHHSSARHNGGC